jgi:N-acetylmuramoyl-L-alanine amidase
MSRALAVLLVLASVAAAAGATAQWQIQRLNGRDYLPVSQIAAFYQMRVVPRGDRGVTLVSESRRLEFAKGSREARIDGVKHWLSFPALYFAGRFYISRMDLAKTLDPLMRPHRIPGLKPVHTVVLDPGHGGHDRGAVNRLGSEKNYVLDLSRRIRAHLQKAGLRVVITRRRDEFIPLERRPAVANRLGDGTVFVSIHLNAAPGMSPFATGYEVFTITPRGAPNSHEPYPTRLGFAAAAGHRQDHASHVLATSIHTAMLGRLPMFDRGVKRARFAVLRHSAVPAVLVEGGFLSNPQDARNIHRLEWRERFAESVARGIIEFVELTRTGDRPKLLSQYRAEEAAALAGTDFDYQPLAGIGRLVRSWVPGAPGWRGLLPAPLGEEMPPFRLEFEPPGWVQLETWASAGEDARSTSPQAAHGGSHGGREWPPPPPPWPGLRGWRAVAPGDGTGGFTLFPSPRGPLAPEADGGF